MQKINVIAKISCHLQRTIVALKLCKNIETVTRSTPVLLWIKTEQFDIQNASLCQHIRELQTSKNSPFLAKAHPVQSIQMRQLR